ncbi:HlyD family secretion protein [Shimia sp.]|uniref:HlyD family secretion protein n=1 Tax=Shimia sp. TaxID=1954381 RepID=UPI003BAA1DBC
MQIRHENPSAQLSWKVHAPLFLDTPDGDQIRIEAWSLAGFDWPEDAGSPPQSGTLSVPFQGVDVRFDVRLTAPDADGTVAFEGLSGRQRETLALFYRSILSGRMASSEDVIMSLDTPVDLVPMEETEEEKTTNQQSRMPGSVRAVIHVVIYLLLAGLIATVLGSALFNGLTRINIQHGRVVAPIAEDLPASEGFVKSIHVVPGQRVEAGEVMVRLRNPAAQAELSQTRARLSLAEKELDRVIEARAMLEALDESQPLQVRGALAAQIYAQFIGDRGFDALWKRWLDIQTHDPEAATAFDPFAFALDKLIELEFEHNAKVRRLRATRDANKSAISMSHVRAPSDGVVHEVLVRKGQPYRHDDLAVVFESDTPRVAMGWVSERYSEAIFIGMEAHIGVNSLGQKTTIAGTVTDVRAGADPRRPGEFGIIVTVTPQDITPAQTKSLLRRDAPVNIQTRRAVGQRMIARIQSLVSRDE